MSVNNLKGFRVKHLLTVFLTFFLFSITVYAQTAPVRLDWKAENAAAKYVIVIEQKDISGIVMEYSLFAREERTVPYIEMSLPEAEYRFKVETYNSLDKIDRVSDWEFFRVVKMRAPEIHTVLPQKINADSSNLQIEIAGNFIHPNAVFYFVSGNQKKLLPEKTEITPDGKSATLSFDSSQLSQMMFFSSSELYAENPGKFITKSHVIDFKPPMTISFGPLSVFDFQNDGTEISMGGFARYQLIPAKIAGTINAGVEGFLAVTSAPNSASGKIPLHFILNFSPVIQTKLFSDRLIGTIRAGIGMYDLHFAVNAGISLDFRFTDLFYCAVDVNTFVLFKPEFEKVLLAPSLTIAGFRF